MILGDRCTRACGFCLVDTRRPRAARPGGAGAGAPTRSRRSGSRTRSSPASRATTSPTVAPPRSPRRSRRCGAVHPRRRVEVLISDCKGDADALATIFAARPDVLNHNLETVARLQRAARPSAGYARSLTRARRAEGGRARDEVGHHPRAWARPTHEVRGALADLRGVGVDIVTLGQYLRPSAAPPPGRPVVAPRRVRRARRVRASRSASPTSRRARSCARATTRAEAPRPRDGELRPRRAAVV